LDLAAQESQNAEPILGIGRQGEALEGELGVAGKSQIGAVGKHSLHSTAIGNPDLVSDHQRIVLDEVDQGLAGGLHEVGPALDDPDEAVGGLVLSPMGRRRNEQGRHHQADQARGRNRWAAKAGHHGCLL
jgi:hypothetical protein